LIYGGKWIRLAIISFAMIQAVLDWKDFNHLSYAITGNEYNTEDIMSIPTSLTRKAPVAVTEDIIEFALAA